MKKSVLVARLLSVAVGLTALAACASAPTETAPKNVPVTLALQWVTQTQFAGYYVALDKGWYAEEGIDLTIRPGGPDTSPINSVALGSAQFGTSLLADVVARSEEMGGLLSVAQIQQRNGLVLLAFKNSGIRQPQDFVGKRVGVWLGAWEAQFNALIAKEGINPNDFTLVSQGFSMDRFLKGELDVASAMIYNEYYTVLESGVRAEALNIIDYASYGLDFPGDTLFTTQKFAAENPDLCARMVRASLRGWKYAVANQAEAVEIVLKYDKSGTLTKQHQVLMMREIARLVQIEGRPVGYGGQADIQRTIDALYRYGVLKSPINAQSIFTNQFWEKAQ